ncbi:MAG: hypothetical protein AB1Z19_07500 [Eubacteriales bacterium]
MYRKMCDICKKNPPTHRVINFTNTKKEVLDICDECYHKRQQGNTLDFIQSMMGAAKAQQATEPQHVCRVCGTTSTSFMRTGLVGCDNCYVDLAPEIRQMIRATQGDINHLGKSPINSEKTEAIKTVDEQEIAPQENETIPEEPKAESERLKLKKALEAAVQMEDYEKAIELRDKLAAMAEENEDA